MYTASPLSTSVRASILFSRIINPIMSDSIFTHFLLLGLGDLRFLQRCFISTPPCWRAGAAGIPLPARGDSNRRLVGPPTRRPPCEGWLATKWPDATRAPVPYPPVGEVFGNAPPRYAYLGSLKTDFTV